MKTCYKCGSLRNDTKPVKGADGRTRYICPVCTARKKPSGFPGQLRTS